MTVPHRTQYFPLGGGGIGPTAPGTAATGYAYAPGGVTGPNEPTMEPGGEGAGAEDGAVTRDVAETPGGAPAVGGAATPGGSP